MPMKRKRTIYIEEDVDKLMLNCLISDETGEIRSGGQREGLENLLTPGETKMSNIQGL